MCELPEGPMSIPGKEDGESSANGKLRPVRRTATLQESRRSNPKGSSPEGAGPQIRTALLSEVKYGTRRGTTRRPRGLTHSRHRPHNEDQLQQHLEPRS